MSFQEVNNPIFSFFYSTKFKDCSLKFILKHRPQYQTIIQGLISKLPIKRYVLVNVHEQVLVPTAKTCSNIDWHVDGESEDYALICFGKFRTEFLRLDGSFFEVADGIPIFYNSSQFHRGRRSSEFSKRILIRVCSSDRLSPKNQILERE
jgi:hypothetical protein